MHRRRRASRRAPRGFSLLEIMVVITLIGLVTAAVGVAVMARLQDGQEKTARAQAYEIAKAVEMFRLAHGRLPSAGEGLDALVAPPSGRPFLPSAPKDPWGQAYAYVVPGEKNPGGFDVRSRGADGQDRTEDDVGNWQPE